MHLQTLGDETQKRLRFLTQLLIFSGSLNITFAIIFLYFTFSERRLVDQGLLSMQRKAAQSQTEKLSNTGYLSSIYDLSFRELLVLLANKEPVEEGFLKRDLALGVLYTLHYFNLEKALFGQSLQKREYFFTDKKGVRRPLALFAALKDAQFEAILHYGCSEKWPFTSEGLFHLMKKMEKPCDVSLEKAFLVTDEFYLISSLFQYQSDLRLSTRELLDLICRCSWPFLKTFTSEQKKLSEISRERRTFFLIGCLETGSAKAAEYLVQTDREYLLKKASDLQLLKLLGLASPSERISALALELLKSQRSDGVWQLSAAHLYTWAKEKPPAPFSRETALKRFALPEILHKTAAGASLASSSLSSSKVFSAKTEIQAKTLKPDAQGKKAFSKKQNSQSSAVLTAKSRFFKPYRAHIVQKGESLWKIARKYKVSVAEIEKLNRLGQKKLKIGQELRLPPVKK
jgi:LysM repeat protein